MAMFSDVVKNFSDSDFPQARPLDPASVPSLRWGIVGAGDIADVFINTLKKHTKQQVVGIASKTAGKAAALAAKHGVDKTYDSYEQLCAQKDIDVIYIATLPNTHLADSLIAINAGKHLLIEKPSTISKADSKTLYDAAKKANIFAMEAMWSRYLPQADIMRQMLDRGLLGRIELIQADFGQDARDVARLWLPGASIVQDMGIYPIAFTESILGLPKRLQLQVNYIVRTQRQWHLLYLNMNLERALLLQQRVIAMFLLVHQSRERKVFYLLIHHFHTIRTWTSRSSFQWQRP